MITQTTPLNILLVDDAPSVRQALLAQFQGVVAHNSENKKPADYAVSRQKNLRNLRIKNKE